MLSTPSHCRGASGGRSASVQRPRIQLRAHQSSGIISCPSLRSSALSCNAQFCGTPAYATLTSTFADTPASSTKSCSASCTK